MSANTSATDRRCEAECQAPPGFKGSGEDEDGHAETALQMPEKACREEGGTQDFHDLLSAIGDLVRETSLAINREELAADDFHSERSADIEKARPAEHEACPDGQSDEEGQVQEPDRRHEDRPGDHPAEMKEAAQVQTVAHRLDHDLMDTRRFVDRQPDEDRHEQRPVEDIALAVPGRGKCGDREEDGGKNEHQRAVPGGQAVFRVEGEMTQILRDGLESERSYVPLPEQPECDDGQRRNPEPRRKAPGVKAENPFLQRRLRPARRQLNHFLVLNCDTSAAICFLRSKMETTGSQWPSQPTLSMSVKRRTLRCILRWRLPMPCGRPGCCTRLALRGSRLNDCCAAGLAINS